jgi:hypothetical protein
VASYGVACYVIRDDLLIFVARSDEQAEQLHRILNQQSKFTEHTHYIVLPPGSDVADLRDAIRGVPA